MNSVSHAGIWLFAGDCFRDLRFVSRRQLLEGIDSDRSITLPLEMGFSFCRKKVCYPSFEPPIIEEDSGCSSGIGDPCLLKLFLHAFGNFLPDPLVSELLLEYPDRIFDCFSIWYRDFIGGHQAWIIERLSVAPE